MGYLEIVGFFVGLLLVIYICLQLALGVFRSREHVDITPTKEEKKMFKAYMVGHSKLSELYEDFIKEMDCQYNIVEEGKDHFSLTWSPADDENYFVMLTQNHVDVAKAIIDDGKDMRDDFIISSKNSKPINEYYTGKQLKEMFLEHKATLS